MKTYTVRYYKTKSDFPHKLTTIIIEAPTLLDMYIELIQSKTPMYSLFYSYLDHRGHRHSFSTAAYEYACYQLKCLNYNHLAKGILHENS